MSERLDPGGSPEYLRPLVGALDTTTAMDIHRFEPPASGAREAAVLILFAEGPAGIDVLLTERAARMRKHSGQVAFPGGARDPEDIDPVDTALREAREEVGLDTGAVRVHAMLPDLYIPVTGFAVSPVVATGPPDYAVGELQASEVARALRVSVEALADPDNRYTVTSPSGYTGPTFIVEDLFVWGFTANVIDSVLRFGGWDREWDIERTVPLPSRFMR